MADAGHQSRKLARHLLQQDRKSTRLNSSHANISYAVFCLKKKKHTSELQSRQYLVCRLLLEKKKNRKSNRCSEARVEICSRGTSTINDTDHTSQIGHDVR